MTSFRARFEPLRVGICGPRDIRELTGDIDRSGRRENGRLGSEGLRFNIRRLDSIRYVAADVVCFGRGLGWLGSEGLRLRRHEAVAGSSW